VSVVHVCRPPSVELRAQAEARCAGFAPPELPVAWLSGAEVRGLLDADTGELDDIERGLRQSARIDGAIELAIAEGLRALTVGDRLCRLGLRLDDYAREVLDLQPRTILKRVRLAEQLRTRRLLRAALVAGEISLRAAEVAAPVAVGEAEGAWVARAARETVRALEEGVRSARGRDGAGAGAGAGDDAGASADGQAAGGAGRGGGTAVGLDIEAEEFGRVTLGASAEELELIDRALEVAGQQLSPGARTFERIEALAQEFLGGHPEVAPEADPALPAWWRASGRREQPLAARKAELEKETERWAALERIEPWAAPVVDWDELDSPAAIDATLRVLAEHRQRWDQQVGLLGSMIKRSGLHHIMGFASFRHYVDERLGLPPRAVEQRIRLAEQIERSPALRRARDEGLSYERLRALAFLPEAEIVRWSPRAKGLTIAALRDALEEAEARQMRARGRMVAVVPQRVVCLLAGAVEAVRKLVGAPLSPGKCLAVMARHFLEVHGPAVQPRTSSQKVRARDRWCCTVPGCSHAADHSHHIEYLSRGGARTDPANQTGVCAFHHRCIHAGDLTVFGRAPEGLRWEVRGEWDEDGVGRAA
jgi:hypothetical protein